MKELINEWRKYVKETKELGGLGGTLEKAGAGEEFLKGMISSASNRDKNVNIVVGFIENSHELNNIFEEALKLMAKYNFNITDLFRPDDRVHSKEQLQDSDKYFQYARDINTAMGKMIVSTAQEANKTGEDQIEAIAKRFNLPNIDNLRSLLHNFKEDGKEAAKGKGFTMRIMGVRHVIEFFNTVAYEIKKDPEKMKKMKERDIAPEMKPFEAPSTSDSEFDLEPDFTLDYAKKIRNRDTYKTDKEINEKKNKKNRDY